MKIRDLLEAINVIEEARTAPLYHAAPLDAAAMIFNQDILKATVTHVINGQ